MTAGAWVPPVELGKPDSNRAAQRQTTRNKVKIFLKLLHVGNSRQKVAEDIPQHHILAEFDVNVVNRAYTCTVTPTCRVGCIVKAMFT